MDIELVNESTVLNDVFQKTYNLVSADKMAFQSCLLINESNLVFVLKEPKRLFTVEKNDSSYKFKMKGEYESFEYIADESSVNDLINKFKKRQVF